STASMRQCRPIIHPTSRPQRKSATNTRHSAPMPSKADELPARTHVRFGSKADICNANRHVRFSSDSDRESGLPQTGVSALPPKADIAAPGLNSWCDYPSARLARIANFLAENRETKVRRIF